MDLSHVKLERKKGGGILTVAVFNTYDIFNNSEFSVILLPYSNQRPKRLLVGRKDIFGEKSLRSKTTSRMLKMPSTLY